jgi:hypothetical protein
LTVAARDGVGDVEVAVCDAVAHPGDLDPREGRCAGEQLRRKSFDRFADLDEADPDGVEDEPAVKIAALGMGTDGLDGGHACALVRAKKGESPRAGQSDRAAR